MHMARIERIRQRLENWALWRSRLDSNSLGFHTVNVLAVDVWGRNSYNGSQIPHVEQEAEETDQAVQEMGQAKSHLRATVCDYYLRDLGVSEIARNIGKGPSTVHAQLGQADQFIDRWLQEQQRIREEREAMARGREYMRRAGSFTT